MAGCLWWCQRAPLKGASKLFWVFFGDNAQMHVEDLWWQCLLRAFVDSFLMLLIVTDWWPDYSKSYCCCCWWWWWWWWWWGWRWRWWRWRRPFATRMASMGLTKALGSPNGLMSTTQILLPQCIAVPSEPNAWWPERADMFTIINIQNACHICVIWSYWWWERQHGNEGLLRPAWCFWQGVGVGMESLSPGTVAAVRGCVSLVGCHGREKWCGLVCLLLITFSLA